MLLPLFHGLIQNHVEILLHWSLFIAYKCTLKIYLHMIPRQIISYVYQTSDHYSGSCPFFFNYTPRIAVNHIYDRDFSF